MMKEYFGEYSHLFFLFAAFFLLITGFLVIAKAGVPLLPVPSGLKEAVSAA